MCFHKSPGTRLNFSRQVFVCIRLKNDSVSLGGLHQAPSSVSPEHLQSLYKRRRSIVASEKPVNIAGYKMYH